MWDIRVARLVVLKSAPCMKSILSHFSNHMKTFRIMWKTCWLTTGITLITLGLRFIILGLTTIIVVYVSIKSCITPAPLYMRNQKVHTQKGVDMMEKLLKMCYIIFQIVPSTVLNSLRIIHLSWIFSALSPTYLSIYTASVALPIIKASTLDNR